MPSLNDIESMFSDIIKKEESKEKYGPENVCQNCGKCIKGIDNKIICEQIPIHFKYDPEKRVMEYLEDIKKLYFCGIKCENKYFEDPNDFMRICRKCCEYYDNRLVVDYDTGLTIFSTTDLCSD